LTTATEQRRTFDSAINRYKSGDPAGAKEAFDRITAENPAMTDAWVGRLACGDHSLATLEGAHTNARALYRETRRIGLEDGALQATVAAPLYIPIQVWSRASIALAYASKLIVAGNYDTALDVLNAADLSADPQAALWRQFITASLYHRTQRWPDLCTTTDACPPANAAYVPNEVRAAVQTLRAMGLAALGQPRPALELIDQVSTQNAHISADLALTKGWCLRELGELNAADEAFRAATVDGQLTPQARKALEAPEYRLVTTDAETIATRTDKWDPATETSPHQRAAAELATKRQQVLNRAQERIDELIGLDDAKEQIAVWRTEIQIDQLVADQDGGGAATSNENHMVFLGPPGTAKTTFARVVGEVLFGLGKIDSPDVKEVTEEDIVVGYVSQTPERMKHVCEEAIDLGGVLFIDEAYRLVPKTEGHSFGVDAINTLLKYMEDHRDEFVVIVAGYPAEMQDFLNANPGLASRFHFTLTFTSYNPGEVVAIARHFARKERLDVEDPAWDLLHAEATHLRSLPYESGTMLDVAGNGRYARKVTIACRRERARRLHRLAPGPQDLETLVRTDPALLKVNADDMKRALTESRPTAAQT
jgi:type VII secretion ATPase EccA